MLKYILKHLYHFSSSGHYCIPLGKLDYKNVKEINLNKNMNAFCNDLNGQSTVEKKSYKEVM